MTIPESQYILDAFDQESCDMRCYFPAPLQPTVLRWLKKIRAHLTDAVTVQVLKEECEAYDLAEEQEQEQEQTI